MDNKPTIVRLRERFYEDYWACANGHISSSRLRFGDNNRPELHTIYLSSTPGLRLKGQPVYDFVRVQAERGKRKTVPVHRLVAHAWLPPKPSPRHVVRHLDGNMYNNSAPNLAWGTVKDNFADRRRHGRSLDGVRNPNHKLTEDDVRAIRARLRDTSDSMGAIGRDFGCTRVMVRYIRDFKNWRHVSV